MKHKHIMQSLPLLASILGRKYGVQVQIGGNSAFTDGKTIHLPTLPLDGDDVLLGLIRGYCDHEAAHIRETDFKVYSAKSITPLERRVLNVLEDWRVENQLADIYPGCRQNFQWLIRHMFLPKDDASAAALLNDPAMMVLNWLLMTVRAWDVPELAKERDKLKAEVDSIFPQLTSELEPVLQKTHRHCESTRDALASSKAINAVLAKYIHFVEQQQQKQGQHKQEQQQETGTSSGNIAKKAQEANSTANKQIVSKQARQSLEHLLAARENELPDANLDSAMQNAITDACHKSGEHLQVAVQTKKQTRPLLQDELDHARQVTTALRTRLQALMQSVRSYRNHCGFTGVLNIRKLHTLATGNAKVFLKRGERVGVNTAVHILLDSSYSMNGQPMNMASEACFAVASALHDLKGISLGVTTFPADAVIHPLSSQSMDNKTVAQVLRHNQKLHTRFGVKADGNTPMDTALWWVLQQLHPLPEPRKIILLITDGVPDDSNAAKTAIKAIQESSIEVYGIGIANPSIFNLLPKKNSQNINDIKELAPAMFNILHLALLGNTSKNL